MQKIFLEPFFSVNDIAEDLIFINCTLGYDGNVNLLFAEKEYDDRKIFKKKDLGGYDRNTAHFKIQPKNPQNYLLIIPEKNKVIRFDDQNINYTHGLQIDSNKYCFVCHSKTDNFENTLENNCRIIDEKESLVNEFSMGVGINGLQTNSKKELWVSYSDRSFFYDDNIIGDGGISCYSVKGEQIHRYTDGPEIIECQSLNVLSDTEIIANFHSGNYLDWYALIKLSDGKLIRKTEWWHYTRFIACLNNKILIKHIYSLNLEKSRFSLLDIDNMEKELDVFEFFNKKRKKLECIHAQKDMLIFWKENMFYKSSMRELLLQE